MELILKITEACNFKCTFCSSTKIAENRTDTLDINNVFRFLERYPNTSTLIINGGDPLMVDPDYYWKIIEYLDEHDMATTLSLTTNLWPFYKNPIKWSPLFNHKRVGINTSFQYGGGRLKGDYSEFTEEDFRNVSDAMLQHVGYRPDFITVITEENIDRAIDNVLLAKEMGVECKLNYAMASGDQDKPFLLSAIYEIYVEIWRQGLTEWEYNTKQMVKRLQGYNTTCPQHRACDSTIRTLQPNGDYYSCGAFGDDKEEPIDFNYEMIGGFVTPLQNNINLLSMKNACFECPMFKICNGCKKTIKDFKRHGVVEEHCKHMKTIAPDILEANGLDVEVTPYVDETENEYFY